MWKRLKQTTWSSAWGRRAPGKTYLAVAMAASALMAKKVSRIILVRPAVEAGERLGFLPGSLQEKVDPYLRPLYDALYDLLEPERVDKMLEKNVIEVAPLAFMRGRTLNDSFIIMDEAQNTTAEQMKMFLTRLGANSKAVITGDITQIDYRTPRNRDWWKRSTCSKEWKEFASATLKTETWCGTRWCSELCVLTIASAAINLRFRSPWWKRQTWKSRAQRLAVCPS